jgi:antitoxin component of RelBE/YafQ-DinJ toxin-antitoxin module
MLYMDKKIINFRMTAKEKKQLKKNADACGMSISAYVRLLSTINLMDRVIRKESK